MKDALTQWWFACFWLAVLAVILIMLAGCTLKEPGLNYNPTPKQSEIRIASTNNNALIIITTGMVTQEQHLEIITRDPKWSVFRVK